MPGKIRSKAQWRKLAGTLPERKFQEMADGTDYNHLPDTVKTSRAPRGGKTRKPKAHVTKPSGRTRKPRPR